MICRITGTLRAIEGLAAVVEPAGMGGLCYEVMVPAFAAERLSARVGERVEFVTLQYLESQNQGASFIPRLVGFGSASEREFFDLLTTVKGIGNRKALRALAVEPGRIAAAIAAKDPKALTKLPEIGARLAETIIAELHGKVDGYLSMDEVQRLDESVAAVPRIARPPEVDEAVRVLIALGESAVDAERLVTVAVDRAARERLSLRNADEIVGLVYGQRG